MGLSLNNAVRTRLWGTDRESRNQGSNERVRVLSGKARSVSSSEKPSRPGFHKWIFLLSTVTPPKGN